jgi:cold-inducible RNA-binding protein
MKIFVGNLPFSVDEAKLREMFAPFGEVDSANVITDRETGRPRGFGFVEMADADARKAIQELANFQMEGRTLNVNEARAREGGGGGGRGGFGGGRGGGGGGYR